MKWSYFLNYKSELASKVIWHLKKLKSEDIEVESIRLDNAGENVVLPALAIKEGFNINFEFTAPNSPQQNGVIEHAFAALTNRGRAMLNGARLDDQVKPTLWAECFNTPTLIDNITLNVATNSTPYELF